VPTLDDCFEFTYCWGHHFHLSGESGNFYWSDPDYPGGDNTIRPCASYDQFLDQIGIPFGRDKGFHAIRDYCGNDVEFVETPFGTS
jgi:hypothetical protein